MVEAGSACNRVAGPRGGFWLPLAGGGEVLVIASDELLQRVELPATTVWATPPPPNILPGLFGKWRIQVDGRGLKRILRNFDL
jgi:hypothetical protein